MPSIDDVAAELERIAPTELAESWDNVGLLVGDRARAAMRVMTCLTLTPTTVREAVSERADLVVVHHPLPFKPLARVTTDTTVGRMLWDLIGAGIAVYSAHTAFDSARDGINAKWADLLTLGKVEPLVAVVDPSTEETVGAGRHGELNQPLSLHEIADKIKQSRSLAHVRIVESTTRPIRRIAIACGSGGSFLSACIAAGCDALVTGEATFHTCLEAEAVGVSLILTGHYASERFAMEQLAETLAIQFPTTQVWASRTERDPLSTC